MKKLLIALTLIAFVGSVTIAAVTAVNNTKTEMVAPDDDPKKKDEAKKSECTKTEKACDKKEAAACDKTDGKTAEKKASACCSKK